MSEVEFKPGLEGIPATRSQISFVDGKAGRLEYRGISIEQLTTHSSFLETSHLLIFGHLPTQTELEHFRSVVRGHRRVKFRITDMIKSFPESADPMYALQTGIAALGLFYPIQEFDSNYVFDTVTRLLAKVPTIVAAFHQMRQGNDPILPDDSLDHAGNFLYMLSGKVPEPWAARIFEVCLIMHAEHTLNASTFALLVSASTLANPYSSVASAISALSGQLHGGANREVMAMLRQIGSVENVRPYVEEKLAKKQRIMGMGHRVYRVKDPRAIILQHLAEDLFDKLGHDKYYDVAVEVERVCEDLLGSKGIYPNVDFYSGLVYAKLGIPEDLFTPVFAIARAAGWLAHWCEQRLDNRLFRPTQIYIGQHDLQYVPIQARPDPKPTEA